MTAKPRKAAPKASKEAPIVFSEFETDEIDEEELPSDFEPTASAVQINTANDYALNAGQNLANHSTSLAGRGKFVRVGMPIPVVFRTKQAAYRFAAWLLALAEAHDLPDEDGAHTFEQVLEAIRNT